jgi:hypothetical protein
LNNEGNLKVHKSLAFLLLMFTLVNQVRAQISPTPVKCGDVITGEVTQEINVRSYLIDLLPGDLLNLQAAPIGGTFAAQLAVYDSPNNLLAHNWNLTPATPVNLSVEVSSTDTYKINVHGPNLRVYGAYTLYIGCELNTGSVVEPQQMPGEQRAPDQVSAQPTSLPTNFIGFPGLPPVDFANAVKLPLMAATPMAGAITPNGGEIIGFTIDAAANDKLDLAVNRLSGNLNLGVVILSPDNKVVFYGGLITSESLSTRLTLPSAGQYTIGVFRVDLLPPSAPEATAFQVTGTLNP